jgi:hypothetical protein
MICLEGEAQQLRSMLFRPQKPRKCLGVDSLLELRSDATQHSSIVRSRPNFSQVFIFQHDRGGRRRAISLTAHPILECPFACRLVESMVTVIALKQDT